MPRGRPRKNPENKPVETQATAQTVTETAVANKPESRNRDLFIGLKLEDCKPYTNDEELPKGKCSYNYTDLANGRRMVAGRDVFMGEPRFFLEHTPKNWVNLIGRFDKGEVGVGQRNIRTLKLKSEQQIAVMPTVLAAQRREDRRMYDQLKKMGIPEKYIGSVTSPG